MSALLKYWWIIFGCLLLGAVGGGFLAFGTPRKYQASQSFLMRDEFSSQFIKPGRFESQEALKSAQETIQELARNPQLISEVLEEIGPGSWLVNTNEYPSIETIEDFQNDIWISAANGAELGKTEVIHLNVKARSKERAKLIVDLLAKGVESQLQNLRGMKARSFQQEAQAGFDVASKQLNEVTGRLKKMEASLGPDLGELRALENPASGDSIIRRSLIQINSDLINQRNHLSEIDQQIRFLKEAIKSKNSGAAIPFELLKTLPTIQELQVGLVKAKIRHSQVAAEFKEKNVRTIKAKNQVIEIQKLVKIELSDALKTMQEEQKLVKLRISSLEKQKNRVETRMTRLANLRTPYHNLIQEIQLATTRRNAAQKDLNWAESSLYGSAKVNLLTRIENSRVYSRPVGLSRTIMLAGSTVCGLFVGIGLVMLLAAPGENVSDERIARVSRQANQQQMVGV